MRLAHSIVVSVCASSLLPALLFVTISSVFDGGFRGLAVIIFPFVLLTTFMHSLCLGIPSFLFLRKFNIVYWWSMLIAGFIVGGLPIPILAASASLLRGTDLQWAEFKLAIIALGAIGAIGGITFWATWKFSNHRAWQHAA